jgi:hypothetical protein
MAQLTGLIINDSGSLAMPAGTQGERPAITPTVSTFTTVGTTSWTAPTGVTAVEVLVVAGGGGGGSGSTGSQVGGGGGGAGGLIYNSNFPVIPGQSYIVTVGSGGTAGTSGGNSVFGTLTALGGGRGGTRQGTEAGSVGGSGGGSAGGVAGALGTVGQGNPGSPIPFAGGGGGGSGGIGGFASPNREPTGGRGGPGLAYAITGNTVYYASGGSSGAYGGELATPANPGGGGIGGQFRTAGTAGTANTGGGGGGSGSGYRNTDTTAGATGSGAAGGSGIVIVRYTRVTANNSDPTALIRLNNQDSKLEIYSNVNKWEKEKNKNFEVDSSQSEIINLDPINYPGSGTTWYNTSQISSNATLVNDPVFEGTHFNFNGSTQYATATLTNPAGDWTHSIEFWMRLNVNQSSLSGRVDPFQIGNVATPNQYSAFDINPGSVNWYFFGNDVTISRSFFEVNKWYHICLTYTGGTGNISNKKIYINGVEVAFTATSGTIAPLNIAANATLNIGRDGTRNAAYFPGSIGNFRVYNKALTHDEIINNYNANYNRYSGAAGIEVFSNAQEILRNNPLAPNGYYWISYDGTPRYVYCEMQAEVGLTTGGGWMYITPPSNSISLNPLDFTWVVNSNSTACAGDNYAVVGNWYRFWGYRCGGTDQFTEQQITWTNRLNATQVKFVAYTTGIGATGVTVNGSSIAQTSTSSNTFNKFWHSGPRFPGVCDPNICWESSRYWNNNGGVITNFTGNLSLFVRGVSQGNTHGGSPSVGLIAVR